MDHLLLQNNSEESEYFLELLQASTQNISTVLVLFEAFLMDHLIYIMTQCCTGHLRSLCFIFAE